jgi:hypothetical protein
LAIHALKTIPAYDRPPTASCSFDAAGVPWLN